jgi:HK97 family phage prohead protease
MHERETGWGFAGIELRAEPGKAPRLVGYASVFNSKSLDLGGFIEIVRPGAFAESLREGRDVVALVEHDMRHILARRDAGNLIIGEDDRGLKVEIEPPDTTVGRDLMTNVRVGNLNGMSFGFRTRKDSWDTGKNPALRELLDVELFDVSVVAMPAYPKTEVALRALGVAREEQARATLRDERLRRAEAALGR